jgi:hypothetical protein
VDFAIFRYKKGGEGSNKAYGTPQKFSIFILSPILMGISIFNEANRDQLSKMFKVKF